MADKNLNINIVAKDKSKQALKGLQGNLDKTKTSLLNLKTALIGLGAGAALKSIITTTARFEDLRTSLTSVTGSAKEGAEAFEFISKFATKTQFGIEDLSKSFIKLKAAGITPSDELLTTFTNTAAITTDQIGSLEAVTDLYARTVSGGLGLEEIQRLGDRGVPILRILEEQLDLTRSEISEFGKTAEGAKKIVDAFAIGIQEEFGDATSNLVGNLSTQFSNLQIAILNAADKFGQGLSPAIKEVTNQITDLIEENEELVISLGENTGGAIAATLELTLDLIVAFKKLNNSIETFTGVAIKLSQILKPNWLGVFRENLENTDEFFGRSKESAETFAKSLHMVANATKNVEEKTVELKDAVYSKGLEKIIEANKTELELLQQKYVDELVVIESFLQTTENITKDQAMELYELKIKMEEKFLADLQSIGDKEAKIRQDNMQKQIDLARSGKIAEVDLEGTSQEEKNKIAKAGMRSALEGLSGHNKAMFQLNKAFKIKDAIIDGIAGVQKALALGPFGIPLAVMIGAMTAANVGTIASTSYSGRRTGGQVTGGTPYMVGEQGQEMFVPNQSGTIIPNDKLSGGQTINVNIHANDTQGFDELLVKRRATIVNVINDALNSQGKEALV